MSRKARRWLYGELPELVRQGVISAESAEAVRRHYGEVDEGRWRQVALTICGALGALLIGLGVIFLLAYNWSALGHSVRTVLSLVPLVLGQGFAAWVLWRTQASAAWREGAAAFLILAMLASVTLVDQTYHISSGYDDLLLPCLLLVLPVIYLLGSSVAALLYLVGTLVWADAADLGGAASLSIWLLVVPLVPHVWQAARPDRYGLRPVFLLWAVALWAGVALAFSLHRVDDAAHIVGYAALYATLCLAGCLWFGDGASVWRRPLQVVGVVGVVISSYVLTFRDVWDGLWYRWEGLGLFRAVGIGPGAVAGLLVLAALVLAGACAWKRRWWPLLLGAAPVLAGVGLALLCMTERASVPAWLFNVYVFVLGAAALAVGFRDKRLAMANVGVLLVALLVVARFFDSEMGLLVKGVACIVVGAGFLAANVLVHRRGRAAP